MTRRKKALPEEPKAEVGEQTAIPVAGPLWLRQMGAAAYLAVVAYPAPEEWANRDKFIEAVKAHLLKWARRCGCPGKRIAKKYRGFPNKRIDQVLSRALRRIWRWRVPAGMAGNWMLADGARLGPCLLPGKIPVGAITLHAPNCPWRAMQALQKLAEQRDEANRERDSSVRDLYRRVWLTTLPVLHLVMPITQRLNTPGNPMRFVLDPSWVGAALGSAARLMEYLPQKIRSFNPRKAIRLLPR